jgi:hypothetical protein
MSPQASINHFSITCEISDIMQYKILIHKIQSNKPYATLAYFISALTPGSQKNTIYVFPIFSLISSKYIVLAFLPNVNLSSENVLPHQCSMTIYGSSSSTLCKYNSIVPNLV